MSVPFTSAEIAQGCPVVLLADELTMSRRIEAGNDAVNKGVQDPRNLVGYMTTPAGPQPAMADGGTFASKRKLHDNSEIEADDRVLSVTDLDMHQTTSGYIVHASDFPLDQSSIGMLIKMALVPITTPSSDLDYVVFQSHHPQEPRMTRGGFVGTSNGKIAGPYVTTLGDQRYFVEIKGCGNAEGGFRATKDKFFSRVVLGGLSLQDTEREARSLQRAHAASLTPIVPLAHTEIELQPDAREKFGRLGAILKLTPSTIRLSYADTQLSPTPQNPTEARMIVGKLLDNFLTKFFLPEDAPVFISPASHLENYLVTDGMKISETDFEDFRELGSSDLPFVHTQTAHFMDTYLTLEHYFTNFGRVEKFDPQDFRFVAATTERILAIKGIKLDLTGCISMEEIAHTLWSDWLVEKDHAARLEQGYQPTAMIDFLSHNIQRLQEISTHTAQQEEDPIKALQAAVREDSTLASQYGEVAHLLYIYDNIFSDETRPLKYRHENTHVIHEALQTKVANAVRQDGETSIPPVVLEALEETQQQREFVTRLYGGLQFFNDWMHSETRDLGQLITNGHHELKFLHHTLTQYKEITDKIMEGADPLSAVSFHGTQLPAILSRIRAMYVLTYRAS